jgi:hypothetical protein
VTSENELTEPSGREHKRWVSLFIQKTLKWLAEYLWCYCGEVGQMLSDISLLCLVFELKKWSSLGLESRTGFWGCKLHSRNLLTKTNNFVLGTVLLLYEGQYESNASNFFFRKCFCSNIKIYMDDSYIFCNYDAIFPQSLCHFQLTFANVE